MCSSDACTALSRTAQLLRTEIFHTAEDDDHAIVEGLRSTTVRLVADRRTGRTAAGQTALVTLFAQAAMMGLQVDLDVPDLELVAPQPPLRGNHLVTSLLEYGGDLIPTTGARAASCPDITFVIGAGVHDGDLRVGWDARRVLLVRGGDELPTSDEILPFLPIAAAAAAAGEALRAALPRVADALGRPSPEEHRFRLSADRAIALDLSAVLDSPASNLGELDAVSGGAITNASLYCLLRCPDVSASVRVIEDDTLELENLNRYALARRSQLGMRKLDVLACRGTERVQVGGTAALLTKGTAAMLRPFAPTVLVGVDNIPSRWLAQQEAIASRMIVGSTDHFFVFDDEHVPGSPCAGCSHPRSERTSGTIPTISFVSMWAGLVQAALLVSRRQPGRATGVYVQPLGLEYPRGLSVFAPDTVPHCPVGCHASRAA